MTCTPAASCQAALSEATTLWPHRSRASDGVCPSAAHSLANPVSDHEQGNAFDLTYDPASGCDTHALADYLRDVRDPRVKYVISNRRIWRPSISPDWRPYNGPNPHLSHVHVSILSSARDDVRPWWPHPEPEEETMQHDIVITDVGMHEARPLWEGAPLPALKLAAVVGVIPLDDTVLRVAEQSANGDLLLLGPGHYKVTTRS